MNRLEVENDNQLDEQHKNHKLGKVAKAKEVPPEGSMLSLQGTSRRKNGVTEVA